MNCDDRPRRLLCEPALLTLILVSAAAAWGFYAMSGAVVAGRTSGFDRRVILALRSPGDSNDPIGPRWFEELMRDFTALGGVGVIVLVTLVAAIFLACVKRRWEATFLVLTAAGATALSLGLKNLFDRPRPDLVSHESFVYTRSFPSGHSMMAACVYLTLAATLARLVESGLLKAFLITVAAVVTIAVGASRVYLGVHWPTDVLAGWTAGAAWALVCWLLESLLHPMPPLVDSRRHAPAEQASAST